MRRSHRRQAPVSSSAARKRQNVLSIITRSSEVAYFTFSLSNGTVSLISFVNEYFIAF